MRNGKKFFEKKVDLLACGESVTVSQEKFHLMKKFDEYQFDIIQRGGNFFEVHEWNFEPGVVVRHIATGQIIDGHGIGKIIYTLRGCRA